jgi:hypothetical protein
MKVKFKKGGKSSTISQSDFIARGGGGEIYLKNGDIFKVCHQGHMPPLKKIEELAVLDMPNIIRPLDVFTTDDGREGYTMHYVNNPVPITTLVPVTYRNRHKIQQDITLKLVQRTQNTVQFIHSKRGYLVVDMNELNLLTDTSYQEIYVIDIDSMQTPNFPADAIMASIRDPQITRNNQGQLVWTELSDWYSFSIISFMLFVGIHPFKGAHPNYTGPDAMVNCMRDNISVLNPTVKYPKAAVLPFSVIPDAYMQWYKAIFVDGKRVPPPSSLVPVIVIASIVPKVSQISGSNMFVAKEIADLHGREIMDHYHNLGCSVLVTNEYDVYIDGYAASAPPHTFKVGFTGDKPIAAYIDNGRVHLQDLRTSYAIQFAVNGEELMSTGGRLYVKNQSQIFEIQFSKVAGQLLASPHKIVDVMDKATQLFEGVAIQSLFDAYNVTVFCDPRQCRQFQMRELDGYKIVEAKHERHVMMVMAVDAQTGKYDRFIFRFARDWSSYDVRVIKDVPNLGLNFTVLDNHKVVCITEDEKMELFLSDKDNALVKQIDDPIIEGDMILSSKDNDVLFSKNSKLYTITIRKP